jgi:glutathione S-transferase/GST-like protein
MYKLYARTGSGSAAVEALLTLLDLPHTVEIVERRADGRAPASLLKINPLGQVPALILPDGDVMTESAAILIHLADLDSRHRYAPALGSPLRARYLRWMIYLATNIYMTDLRFFYPQRYTTDPKGAEAVKQAALNRFEEEWQVFAEALGKGPFILGETMSAADIYAAMLAAWNRDVSAFFARHSNVKGLCSRVTAVSPIADIWARNELAS